MDRPTELIAIPRSRFCSDDIPEVDRVDAWGDSIALLFRPHLADGVTPRECAISTDAFLLGETVLGSSSMAGIGGYRNPGSSPTRDVPELFIIQYFWRGGFAGYNGAQPLQVNAGDIVIMDTTRGISLTAIIKSDVLTFVIPRRVLLDALGTRGNVYPRVISGKSLTGQILGHALLSAWHGLPQQSVADVASVSGLLLGALAGMIRGSEGGANDTAVDHATLATICAYIERHLADPELGPEQLCKRFNCSRARLYRLFAPLDGVANYIRKARLERCHATLLSTSRKVNVSTVALEWGFGSISHFNRLFREAYGVSPSEIRGVALEQHAATAARRNASRLWVPEYQQWLERL